jgi:hypothetical protein
MQNTPPTAPLTSTSSFGLPTTKEGWIFKQGPPPWKAWKKRWLVSTEQGLSYFNQNKGKFSLKGSIPFSNILAVDYITLGKKKGFKVDTPARAFLFSVPPEKGVSEEKEARDWVAVLTAAVANNYNHRKKRLHKPSTLKRHKKRGNTAGVPTSQPSSTNENLANIPTRSGTAPSESSPRQKPPPPPPASKKPALRIGGGGTGTGSGGGPAGGAIPLPSTDLGGLWSGGAAGVTSTEGQGSANFQGKVKEGGESADEISDGFATMVITDLPPDGEYKVFIAPKFPSESELKKMSKPELRKLDDKIEADLRMELEQVEKEYVPERNAILDALMTKEIDAVIQKYDKQKSAILDEIQRKTNCGRRPV